MRFFRWVRAYAGEANMGAGAVMADDPTGRAQLLIAASTFAGVATQALPGFDRSCGAPGGRVGHAAKVGPSPIGIMPWGAGATNRSSELRPRWRKAMSGVFSAAPGASVGEAAPGKVFPSEFYPVDIVHSAAHIHPEKVAVVDGEPLDSYRQLAERSWRLANALRSAGLGKGDRVATRLNYSHARISSAFSC